MQVILDKRYPVAAPPEAAWALLADVRALATCMPGAEITDELDDRHYKGHVKVRVGPTTAVFAGEFEVVAIEPAARRLHLVGKGTDKGGSSVSMDLDTALEAADDGSTVLRGKADVIVNGKLAQFGGRMLNSVSDVVLAQFAANFAERCRPAPAAIETGAPDLGDPMADEVHPHAEQPYTPPRPPRATAHELNALALAWRVVRHFVAGLFGRSRG
jgi:hypothetical protein